MEAILLLAKAAHTGLVVAGALFVLGILTIFWLGTVEEVFPTLGIFPAAAAPVVAVVGAFLALAGKDTHFVLFASGGVLFLIGGVATLSILAEARSIARLRKSRG